MAGKRITKEVDRILNDESISAHPSRIEDIQIRNAIKYLAYRLEILEQIVKAYKTGKL